MCKVIRQIAFWKKLLRSEHPFGKLMPSLDAKTLLYHDDSIRVCVCSFLFQVREWRSKLRKEQRVIDRQIRGELVSIQTMSPMEAFATGINQHALKGVNINSNWQRSTKCYGYRLNYLRSYTYSLQEGRWRESLEARLLCATVRPGKLVSHQHLLQDLPPQMSLSPSKQWHTYLDLSNVTAFTGNQ